MTGYVRKAEPKDAIHLSKIMRKEDIDEIMTSHGVKPLAGLLFSFSLKNSQVYTMIGTNKKCIGMFGVSDCPFVKGYGVVWMLSSDDLLADARQFIKECRKWVDKLNDKYEVIYNWVHPENWKTLKWLQFCGFEPKLKHKYGIKDEEFLLVMRQKNV
jgi:hypothetical protein